MRRYVVVDGPPASGKTTIAPALAAELGLPLVAKDVIKDALMDALGAPDVEASRRLGGAAVRAMFAVAHASPIGAVIESNLYRSAAVDDLRRFEGPLVEVFCRCPRDLAWQRYRDRSGTRHAGHFDGVRTQDELWNDEVSKPVAGGWPVIELDTTDVVDVTALAARIRSSWEIGR